MSYCHENYEFGIHHYRPALVTTAVSIVVVVVVDVLDDRLNSNNQKKRSARDGLPLVKQEPRGS